MRKSITFLTIVSILTSSAFGQEEERKEEWDFHLEFAYVKTSGNTQTDTMALKFNADKEGKINRFFIKSESLYKKDQGKESANKLIVDGRWEKIFYDEMFTFLNGRYERDKFSGYEYKISGGPGLGYDILNTDKMKLKSLLSLIQYYNKFSEGDKSTESYSSGKLELYYKWDIKEDLQYKLDINYIVSFKDNQNYFINGETGVEIKINSLISMGVSYKVNYQNQPPDPDIKRTDTTFLTSVIIDF
ncbi:DUF481 domain-containing protein [Persephonella sp.]